jgi:hypothetical protein
MLSAARLDTPAQTAAWLGAVQAQDYQWAQWSIGLRIGGVTGSQVEQAVQERQIVRTWLMRGTLHFVAAGNLGWITALLAPGIIQGNARRYRQLELGEADFAKSQAVLRRVMESSGPLTRPEIQAHFEQQGIPAQGQQLPYLLQRASLDGLICHGPLSGRQPTYVLRSDWIGEQPVIDRAEALARLAARYFTSHGPATLQDFAWWSGLSAREARQALDSAATLVALEVNGARYWTAGEPPTAAPFECAHLLPPFDDYLLGYKDRSMVLDPAYAKQVNAGGGMPRPTVVVNGAILAVWSYQLKKQKMLASIRPFRKLALREVDLIAQAAAELGSFLTVTVEIDFAP